MAVLLMTACSHCLVRAAYAKESGGGRTENSSWLGAHTLAKNVWRLAVRTPVSNAPASGRPWDLQGSPQQDSKVAVEQARS